MNSDYNNLSASQKHFVDTILKSLEEDKQCSMFIQGRANGKSHAIRVLDKIIDSKRG